MGAFDRLFGLILVLAGISIAIVYSTWTLKALVRALQEFDNYNLAIRKKASSDIRVFS